MVGVERIGTARKPHGTHLAWQHRGIIAGVWKRGLLRRCIWHRLIPPKTQLALEKLKLGNRFVVGVVPEEIQNITALIKHRFRKPDLVHLPKIWETGLKFFNFGHYLLRR